MSSLKKWSKHKKKHRTKHLKIRITFLDILNLIFSKFIEITSWKACVYRIFTRVGEVSEIERVRFLILHQWVWKSSTKCFPCCNLFSLYILTFSHPQKYILALYKFESQTTWVHRKYYLVKAALQSYLRWPRKSPQKHKSLKPWFVIGQNDIFTCEKLVLPLWLVAVKSVMLFHTATFDAKISVDIK